MSQKNTPDTQALDAYFASFEPIDVRPRTPSSPSKLPSAPSRVSSRTRSTVRLCLETLEAREVPAMVFGTASNDYDSALVWTPPSGAYETVTTELEAHATGKINDHSVVNFGEGINANVWTGGEQFGLVGKDGALLSIGDGNGPVGTVDVPLANDHLIVQFPTTLIGATAIRLKHLNPSAIATGIVHIDGPSGRTTIAIPADGVIPWNPGTGIDQVMVINQHPAGTSRPLGLDGIDVRMYLPATPGDTTSLQQQKTTLEQQVATAQAALTAAQQNATPAAITSMPWPEGTNAANKILGKINVHPGQNLYAAHFSPDGSKFVTAAQDKVAKIWNAETGALIRTLTGNNSLVIDAVWSADGQSVWTSGYDRHVRQYSVADGSMLWDSGDLGGLALSAAMSANGATLMVDMHGMSPITINTQNKQINNIGAGFDWADQVQAMADGNIAIGTEGTVSIINPATRERIWQSGSIGGTASAVGATPDGQWIFSGTDGGVLKVWKRSNGQLAFTLPAQSGCITSITVSPEGNQLFVGSGSQVQAFDLRPLSSNQIPTVAHAYTGIGTGPRTFTISGKAAMFVSGDGAASRLVALDRSFFAGYQDPNAAVEAATVQLTTLSSQLANVQSQLALLQGQNASRSDIEQILDALAAARTVPAGSDSLEMSAIQARRLHVAYETSNLRSLRFTLSSPANASYVDFVRPDGSFIARPVIEHAGGTLNGQFGYTFESPNMPNGGYTIRVYSNIGRTELIDEIGAGYFHDSPWLNSVEPQAAADTLGERFSFELDELGGTAEIRAWQGVVQTQPTLRALTDDRDGFNARSAAVTLDLASANHLPTGVSFDADCEQSGAQITVVFYRGQQEIGRQTVTAGSRVSFADAGGITSAIITNPGMGTASTGAVLEISNVQIAGNQAASQVDADPVGRRNNLALALVAHPDWHQNADTLRRGVSPGYNAVGRFSGNAVGLTRDMNKYSVINLTTLTGSAHPSGVSFHILGGDAQLDPEYWDIIGNTVVLYPGAPAQIVIYLNSGDPYQSAGDVDLAHYQASSLDDLPMPSQEMTIRTDILAIRDVNAVESVGEPIMSVPDTGRAITPTQGNVLMNVWNSGRTGGTVRVITNEGTANAREVSFSLGAQAGKSVALDFSTPANGVLSVTVVLPDGRRVVDGRTLKLEGDSDEKRVATRQADGTWKLEWKPSSYAGPTVNDGGIIDPGFVAWKQEKIAKGDLSVADPANYAGAVLRYAEEMSAVKIAAETQEYPDQQLGIGGSYENNAPGIQTLLSKAGLSSIPQEARTAAEAVSGILKRTMYDHMLTWLPASATQNDVFMFNGQPLLRVDTVAGRILAGGIHTLWNTTDPTSRWNVAFRLQVLTDIPANRFMQLLGNGAAAYASSMQALVSQAQYGHLLTSAQIPTGILMAASDRTTYTDSTRPVRVRFDLSLNLADVRQITVLKNGTAMQASAGKPVISAAATFIEIPAAAFNTSGSQQLTLQITTGSSQKYTFDIPQITVAFEQAPQAPGSILNFSTNPDTQQSHLENVVLTMLNQRFYVNDASSWTWLIASGFHADDAFHAVDLSMSDNADDGAPVYAPMQGKVVYNQRDNNGTGNSTLVLEHRMKVDGKDVYWYTKYLHMYCDANGQVGIRDANGVVTPLAIGSTVSGQIGNVGNVSGDPAMNIHIHQESFVGLGGKQLAQGDYFDTDVIDQRKLLTNQATDAVPGLQVDVQAWSVLSAGTNGSPISVRWQEGLGWVSDAQKMVYNRTQQQNGFEGNESYWTAWEELAPQGKRLTWTNVSSNSNVSIMRWITSEPAEAGKNIWNPATGQWATLTESLQW